MLKYGYEKVNMSVFLPLFQADPTADSQSRRGLFKIATFRRWMVVVSGPEVIEDIRKAPDDVLSMEASSIEVRMLPGMLDSYS
jgi:hypothetical protein